MKTVTEILIDFSGSMKDKLPLTKQVLLSDVIPNLDYSSRIGIKTFAKNNDTPPTEQLLNLNITNKDEIIRTINSLGIPKGGTPISAAILASVATLKEYAAYDKKIILVTDGQEDAGGNYVAVARKASAEGINCQVHIVGIGLNDKAIIQAKEIAKLTSGSFSLIPYTKGASYNSKVIQSNLSNFFSAVKSPAASVTANNIQKTVVQTEPKENIVASEEAKLEMDEPTENKIDNLENTEALKLIIEEIKAIKEQLKGLKNEKPTIPDIVEDAEHNEKIRKASEEYLFEILKKKYPDRVKWLNENGESNIDHDFKILDNDNGSIEYYIECKGTVKNKPTFYLTKNEWRLFLNHTKNYQIYFVQKSFGHPTHIFIDNLLDWILKGKLVPYLKERDIIKEERVFLTLSDTIFDK